MKRGYTRREFLVGAGAIGAAVALTGSGIGKEKVPNDKPSIPIRDTIAIARGNEPATMVAAAVAAVGGMEAFVKAGDRVVVKPNASWARKPEDAATTNPEVIAALVRLCKMAGASEVVVVDHVIDKPAERVFRLTGIASACETSGARLVSGGSEDMYRRISIPGAAVLTQEQVVQHVLDADVFINVPVAKHHRDGSLSLGLKNMMGVVWNRQSWHSSPSIDACIAEFARAVKPQLTVLDANRILLTRGPCGPGETKDVRQVIAGVDPVAVDAYGSWLFGLDPRNIEHIRLAHEYGVGEIDLKRVRLVSV